MLTAQLLQATNDLVAAAPPTTPPSAPPGPTASIDTSGIIGFMVGQILPTLLVIIGIILVGRSRAGQWAKVLSTLGILLIGVIVIGGAGSLASLGNFLANLILS